LPGFIAGIGDQPDLHAWGDLIAGENAATVFQCRMVQSHVFGRHLAVITSQVSQQQEQGRYAVLLHGFERAWRADDLSGLKSQGRPFIGGRFNGCLAFMIHVRDSKNKQAQTSDGLGLRG
jgi:hypothetical protein